MEGNPQGDEKKKVELVVGKAEACPCHTTPKETAWDEAQWKKHWTNLRKGHKDNLAKLHKEARGHG